MSKHIPGPYELVQRTDAYGFTVTYVMAPQGSNHVVNRRLAVVDHPQNGPLFAAAPEMLDALYSALSLLIAVSGPQLVGDELEQRLAPLRQAIAKAEGEIE